jgi:phosphoribosylformylglycinamidine synthase
MKARVHVTLKDGVLDPQGKAVMGSLSSLGFSGVNDIRQGKFIEIDMESTDVETARKQVTEMCEKLLANTIIENYSIDIDQ